MKILLTNIWLHHRGGTEVYVRDLAIELHRRGHQVEVFTPMLGPVSESIQFEGIHTCDNPEELTLEPDLIHGHHFGPTMEVLNRFRDVPAIYVLHDKRYQGDTPPHSRRILRFVAVDAICRQKLIDFGVSSKSITTLLNWVDTTKFKQRDVFSDIPAKALVLSNYAKKDPDNYVHRVLEACKECGIPVDVIGLGFGTNTNSPQDELLKYDLIFAKGKSAIEALASGAGLIVCDFHGLGGMVQPDNYEFFRANNFGMNTMKQPHDVNAIVAEIGKFNALNNKHLSNRIRKEADLSTYVDALLRLYQKAIRTYKVKKFFINRRHDRHLIDTYLQTRALPNPPRKR